MLAKRLCRKGLPLVDGILAAALSREAAASVPLTVEPVSARAVALADGVIRAMLITKLKIATALFLVLGFIAYSSSTLVSPAADGEPGEVPRSGAAEGAASLVQVRIAAPVGMKAGLLPAKKGDDVSEIEAPGRFNLAWGNVYRLKLSDIPQHPGVSYFPTVEIPKPDGTTRPFVNSSAIAVELTDQDFDHVDKGDLITKVVYITRGRAVSVASYEFPDGDVIQEARRRGAILVVVRMGNIDLQGHVLPADPKNLVKIDIGDDGKLGLFGVTKDKPLEGLARRLERAQAKNEELKQQLKAMELEIKSLRMLLERKERDRR
jgi:hypothetical protein